MLHGRPIGTVKLAREQLISLSNRNISPICSGKKMHELIYNTLILCIKFL